MTVDPTPLDRRRFLVLGGMAAVAAACSSSADDDARGAGATASTSAATSASTATPPSNAPDGTTSPADITAPPVSDDPPSAESGESAGLADLAVADFESLGVCVLLAESAAGPFPNLTRIERRDVTEGSPGHPVRLGLRVVDDACAPVPGAVVEIWHADATGDYSSYIDGGDGKDEGEGTTFLRGAQPVGRDGIVEFHTIYPGWYPGRTVHIHVRVLVDGELQLTSQLYFDDAYTRAIFTAAPYAEFGEPDTPNDRDPLAAGSIATGGLVALAGGATAVGDGTVALANLGITV